MNMNCGGADKIFPKKGTVILSLFVILLFMGCAAAAEDDNLNDSQIVNLTDSQVAIESNNTCDISNSESVNDTAPLYNESETEFYDEINASAEQLDYLSGCCSVLLHVRDGYDVFVYRRDSTYAANLYITVTSWYGKTAVKEYKTTGQYFFHTIVTLDGWMVGIGGADYPGVVQQLESLAGNAAASGSITSSTISRALTLVSGLGGIGHFIIKSPNNVVGYAIVNGGRKSGLFTMSNGQYIAVPNSPSCYRSGYVSTSAPVTTTMSLAYNNPWGVNHRNVIAYEYVKTSDLFSYITKINVYASKSIRSDNIIFRGQFISGSSLPTTPSKRFIGQIVKKVSRPTTEFGYENMIYTYSDILDTYSTTGSLPSSVGVGPWMVTVEDVIEAAGQVKTYVDNNHKLPSSVTVNGIKVTMSSFLQLLTSSVVLINNNDLDSLINPKSYGSAPKPRDSMTTGYMPLSEYVAIAQNVKNFMNSYGRAPNFAVTSSYNRYTTSLGSYFSYQNMIYTYCKILDTYNNTGTLPKTIEVKSWSKIINDHTVATFTIEESVNAAIWVKEYTEANQKLPDYVTINGINVNMASFLELLTTVTQKIYKNDFTSIDLACNYKTATSPLDNQKTGTMTLATYITIAGKVQRYMDRYLKAPNYSSYSTLGTRFGYQNLIYTYSKILDTYNTTKTLPTSIKVVPWSYVVNFAGIFTIDQTVEAACWVKKYIDTNHELPTSVTINGTNINGKTRTITLTMPTFLKLLTTITQKIYKNDHTPTTVAYNYKAAKAPQDNQKTGTISMATYVYIAGKVQRYMDRYHIAPNYSSHSPLGTRFGYPNLIYTYANILSTYNSTGTLPGYVTINPWRVKVEQVVTAAKKVKTYVDDHHELPSSVTVGEITVSMPTFLKLLTLSVIQINKKDLNTLLTPQIYGNPPYDKDAMRTRKMTKSEYINIALKVKNFMNSYGRAPACAIALK